MSIHHEGYKIIAIGLGLIIAINVIIWITINPAFNWIKWVVLGLSLVGTGLLRNFFRNPEIKVNPDPDIFLSPAYGTVVSIEEDFEDEYFTEKRLRISIFMSIYDVHLNRVPISGKLVYYKYHPGKYLVAFHPKSSKLNEHNTSVIKDEKGREVLFRQIAGAVARRISYYLEEGEEVTQGEELGFIRFGSRVDVFFPVGTKPEVVVGQHVKAAQSVLVKY